jgi:hypothetical protein
MFCACEVAQQCGGSGHTTHTDTHTHDQKKREKEKERELKKRHLQQTVINSQRLQKKKIVWPFQTLAKLIVQIVSRP